VVPTSACTSGDQFGISRAGGSDSSPPRPDLGGSGPGPKDPKPQMHTPILTCKSCRADAGSPVMMAHGYPVFETTACPAKSRREPGAAGAAGAPGRGSPGRDHKIQDARLDLVIRISFYILRSLQGMPPRMHAVEAQTTYKTKHSTTVVGAEPRSSREPRR
jgi:hypothetical protein